MTEWARLRCGDGCAYDAPPKLPFSFGAAALLTLALVGMANPPAILAQSDSAAPQWQVNAGGHMAFDVAFVKVMEPGLRGHPPNFSLDSGNGFTDPLNGTN